jgi:acyl-CoA thioester hydrolase
MTRTTLEPPKTAYRYRFRVASADIDEIGHANNVVWLRWINDAALAHAETVGMGPRELLRSLSLLWVVRRHDIEYLQPALEGDEVDVVTWPRSLTGVTSIRWTLFTREQRLLARAETTWALIDRNGKLRRVPPEILDAYGFTASADAALRPSVSEGAAAGGTAARMLRRTIERSR